MQSKLIAKHRYFSETFLNVVQTNFNNDYKAWSKYYSEPYCLMWSFENPIEFYCYQLPYRISYGFSINKNADLTNVTSNVLMLINRIIPYSNKRRFFVPVVNKIYKAVLVEEI